MKLENKVILVTGASKGIGAAICASLAVEGAQVLLNYKSDTLAAQELKSTIEKGGGAVSLIKADVTDEDELAKMFEEIKVSYGKLDAVIGNAGGLLENEAISAVDVFRRTFELNMFSQVSVVRGALPLMREGKIIFVSSVHGGLGRGEGRVISYSASKAALNSYMKNLAKELAPNILVNAISPGRTATPA